MTDAVSIILGVTMDISLYFTEEEYYPKYKEKSGRKIFQDKIKKNVRFYFIAHSFLILFLLLRFC